MVSRLLTPTLMNGNLVELFHEAEECRSLSLSPSVFISDKIMKQAQPCFYVISPPGLQSHFPIHVIYNPMYHSLTERADANFDSSLRSYSLMSSPSDTDVINRKFHEHSIVRPRLDSQRIIVLTGSFSKYSRTECCAFQPIVIDYYSMVDVST